MIITRTPSRITFGGGGTDLPSYYSKYSGFLVSAAVNKYVYINLHDIFIDKIIAHYSKSEMVNNVDELRHPIIREALKLTGVTKRIEVGSMSDIPARAGLGSSGSFTVGLLKALHIYKKEHILPNQLAEEACKIEIDILKEPVGKQDQYIAAFGGITAFTFSKDGHVTVVPLRLSSDVLLDLEENLLLFFTGFLRKSHSVLEHQDILTKSDDVSMINSLHEIKKIGIECKKALEQGNTVKFGELLDIHWQSKKARSKGMSNPKIDRWYDIAMKHGAVGGKLVGGGGGGFLMFYAKDKDKLRKAMAEQKLCEVRFSFDFEGSKVLVSN
ncbi:MAG: galactokinase [Candidatus Thermoplasmatota archaeon]|nr:galactokinase [Candidatus Thermoplasmatota archaeon]